MNKKISKKEELKNDIQGITNLMRYSKDYPSGAIKIGYHYYNVSALINAMSDIKSRSVIGGTTKADSLLMQILAGLM